MARRIFITRSNGDRDIDPALVGELLDDIDLALEKDAVVEIPLGSDDHDDSTALQELMSPGKSTVLIAKDDKDTTQVVVSQPSWQELPIFQEGWNKLADRGVQVARLIPIDTPFPDFPSGARVEDRGGNSDDTRSDSPTSAGAETDKTSVDGTAPDEPASPPSKKAQQDNSADKAATKPATESKPDGVAALVTELARARRPLPDFLKKPAASNESFFEKSTTAFLEEEQTLTRSLGWAVAPDAELFLYLDDAARRSVAADILKARAGIPVYEPGLLQKQLDLEDERIAYYTEFVDFVHQFTKDRKRWRALSKVAMRVLTIALIFSAILSLWVIYLASDSKIDGWQAATIIFVLAVVAISPVVLLLLERPLKGIDSFTPPGAPTAQSSTTDTAASSDTSSAKS
ncbi:hypothetical protein [Microbacterium rhizosphaerae]|uniref:Uncharacterized protein n=1 Tax=Microbacterium rhizosphaerae TaxID=1678237 RepID=A0ABZ0SSP2_9MICO|nr:hypothetical protein [Microbacterium rhizosphaerae]WPR91326.1 hypothetical protein SM116_08635 [Microbacterium rhizosphaerae]